MRIVRKIKKFRRIDFTRKKLFFEALWLLYFMKFQLFLFDFKTLAKRYEIKLCEIQCGLEPNARIKQIGWAVNKAAYYFPWEGSCLLQALTLQRMCVKRKLHAEIYFGVTRDQNGAHQLKAHAWTKAGNYFLTGKKGHRAFTVIARFSW